MADGWAEAEAAPVLDALALSALDITINTTQTQHSARLGGNQQRGGGWRGSIALERDVRREPDTIVRHSTRSLQDAL